jgi:hypothetical protein
VLARGFCNAHYKRLWRTGVLEPLEERWARDPEERFWEQVDKTGEGCWLWLGCLHDFGYGMFSVRQRRVYAHRFAYELLVGPIPDGLEIDHLCRNPRCVNPEHLEPVTHAENILRGEAPSAHNARKTHWVRGHRFNRENTYVVKATGARMCRRCVKERATA